MMRPWWLVASRERREVIKVVSRGQRHLKRLQRDPTQANHERALRYFDEQSRRGPT